jgi:hypothetical protein
MLLRKKRLKPMGLKVKLVKKGSQFKKLIQQIHRLNNESVEIGHFKSQGEHESGFTYPELMALHHRGNPETPLPPRPVLAILFFRFRKLKTKAPAIDRAFKAWGKRKSGDSSDKILLNDIGEFFREEEKKIFGSSTLAPNAVPPKAFNNPLIDTGDLKSKVAYKTSKDKQVKEG